MKKQTNIGLIALLTVSLTFSGCAAYQSGGYAGVLAAAQTDIANGLTVTQDYFTAAAAVQQNNNGQKLTFQQVLSDAQSAATAANSSGLTTAVATLVEGVNAQIKSTNTPAQNVAATTAVVVPVQTNL